MRVAIRERSQQVQEEPQMAPEEMMGTESWGEASQWLTEVLELLRPDYDHEPGC